MCCDAVAKNLTENEGDPAGISAGLLESVQLEHWRCLLRAFIRYRKAVRLHQAVRLSRAFASFRDTAGGYIDGGVGLV